MYNGRQLVAESEHGSVALKKPGVTQLLDLDCLLRLAIDVTVCHLKDSPTLGTISDERDSALDRLMCKRTHVDLGH